MARETKGPDFRQATQLARSLLEQDVLVCQSALVESLLAEGDREGWTVDDIENLYPHVHDAGVERCHEVLIEHGAELPVPNPFIMDRGELHELALKVSHTDSDGLATYSESHLRQFVIIQIDEGSIAGLDEWREAAGDCGPQEVFEWWLVTPYLARHLRDIDEPILDNDYGCWWGRTCTGQSILLDGTLQRIARRISD